MKDFFKHVFATMVGLFLFGFVMTILAFISLVGIIAGSENTNDITDNSVLVLNLDGIMSERTEDNFLNKLNGVDGMSFEAYQRAIRNATDNDKIKGIFIQANSFGAEMAHLEELRQSLSEFKKAGKWIIAYGEEMSQASYYLSSLADKIYLNPAGELSWAGLGGETKYVKHTLAKIGIRAVPVKVGKYKSAVEIFTEDKMSDANREQTERYLNGWWNKIVTDVAASRKISKDSLNAYADRLISLEDQQQLVKARMIDGLIYNDQTKAVVAKMLGQDKDDDINQVAVSDLQEEATDGLSDQIAVYTAVGDIVDSSSPQSVFRGGSQIVGKDFCKDMQALADDKNVKAVVLRVNSGGGSAYASEQMWHQIMELKKKKPVVVSMSGAAASGGYYISSAANYIVADANTITGSIGIFGILGDRSKLYTQLLGMKFDEVKTNRNSVIGAQGHFFSDEQFNLIQRSVERGYLLFKKRVAGGRRMTMEQVEAIAQGHVYLGSDALRIHLVDALGNLDTAVRKAAQLAKLDDYNVKRYPEEKSLLDQLLDMDDSMDSYLNGKLRLLMGDMYEPLKMKHDLETMDRVQARLPFSISLVK
ncbi:signal peptide peptidase SppA [Prevotella sp. A2931]|uniref:Signal peptide peptidase SppA n=1 Tax=Prevotella illustrans TaxID=2800387 RepID=A0ABS3M834_9BACT|nr:MULTISPECIES: signal peptide peptidase SppA [Prevotella]MBO1364348.1 signal peptide peptidase SppA [Prevotella illustrans]PTL27268.1 signal peptide peptidase SppA [Prevotella sp. oral taxon 820]